jgi:hypothetical protein
LISGSTMLRFLHLVIETALFSARQLEESREYGPASQFISA